MTHQDFFTFWSMIILRSQAAQAKQHFFMLKIRKMSGTRTPNNKPGRPYPTNNPTKQFRNFKPEIRNQNARQGGRLRLTGATHQSIQKPRRKRELFLPLRSTLILLMCPSLVLFSRLCFFFIHDTVK